MEQYLLRYLSLQEKIVDYTTAQTSNTEQAFQILSFAVDEIPGLTRNLKGSVQTIGSITHSMENLQSTANQFNFAAPTLKTKSQLIENVETPQPQTENIEGETFI